MDRLSVILCCITAGHSASLTQHPPGIDGTIDILAKSFGSFVVLESVANLMGMQCRLVVVIDGRSEEIQFCLLVIVGHGGCWLMNCCIGDKKKGWEDGRQVMLKC